MNDVPIGSLERIAPHDITITLSTSISTNSTPRWRLRSNDIIIPSSIGASEATAAAGGEGAADADTAAGTGTTVATKKAARTARAEGGTFHA